MDRYIMVMVGAAVGGLARYLLGTAVMERFGSKFPLGTFLINISGSFLIGVVMTLLTERFHAHPNWRLLLVVGLIGGYTTFSSFEYETLQSVRQREGAIALLYIIASVVVGYIAVWFGAFVAGRR